MGLWRRRGAKSSLDLGCVGRVTKEEERKEASGATQRAPTPRRAELLAQSDRIPGFADHPVKVFTKLLFLTQPTFMGIQRVQSTL